MKRRSVLLLPSLAALAGCGSPGSAQPRPSTSGVPDYSWPDRHPALTKGFCFTLVRGLAPTPLIKKLNAEELQRVEWNRLIGPGDGEAGVRSRFFVGMAKIDDWSLVVEDNGSLGVTPTVVQPVSVGPDRLVLGYRGGGGRPGRLMMFRDGDLLLDLDPADPGRATGSGIDEFQPNLLAAGLTGGKAPAQPTAAALTFLSSVSGFALTEEWLGSLTYLLVAVPQP